MKLSFIQYIWLLLALVVLLPQIQSEVVTFRFPEYDYKETSKNVMWCCGAMKNFLILLIIKITGIGVQRIRISM